MKQQLLSPNSACPMAKVCNGLSSRPYIGFAPHLIGAVLVLLGVATLFEPRVIVGIVAAFLILLGVTIIFVAVLLRKMGERISSLS